MFQLVKNTYVPSPPPRSSVFSQPTKKLGVATPPAFGSLRIHNGWHVAPPWEHFFSIGPSGRQNRHVMPRPKKHAASAKANGRSSAAGQQVSQEERNELQMMSQLTIVTASTAHVFKEIERAPTVRYNRLWANDSWAYVKAHFHELPLKHDEGDYDNATGDYGALRSRFTFEPPPEDDQPWGLKFLGTKSYDKKGVAKNTLGISTKPYTTFLQHLFMSLAATPDMALINPRAGLMRGLRAGMHTDANTRGAHPNAMRCLDVGGGLRLDRRISFRCSLVTWKGTIILPLDLNPHHFRWVQWDGEEMPAIKILGAEVYWAALEMGEFMTIGCIGGSLITMGGGFIYVAPMNYFNVCATKANLIPLTYQEALSNAKGEPIPPETGPPQIVGDDPTKWFVFFGWRFAHETVGCPWVRRAHVTGCPYRQNGSGQNRRAGGGAKSGERAMASAPSWCEEIERLREGDTIRVQWKCGEWKCGQVVSIGMSLYAPDVGVLIRYWDSGCTMCAPLAVMVWEHVPG